MVKVGSRLHGLVAHVITRTGDVSACGRMVLPGKGEAKRMCRTCVRVNGDARKIDDTRRKSARESVIMTSETTGEQYVSWEYALSRFELDETIAKIAKINERCAKRGIPGGLSVEYTERIVKEKNDLGIVIEKLFYDTHITGIAPQLPGWEFIGVIDFDQHAGLIVRGYPGATQIDRSAIRDGWCDHCQTERYRKSTMVVHNRVSGEQIQVGSSCIKDFTGWTALPYTFDRMSKDVEDMCEGFGAGSRDVTTKTVLGVAWACVTTWGFVRSNEAGATVHAVRDVINPPKPSKGNEDYLAELGKVRALAGEMEEKAKALRAWIASDEFSGHSDYVLNLKSIAAAHMVSNKNYGILASAPQAWARFLEKSLIRKIEADTRVSEHVGEIGERWALLLTVESERYIETAYGSSTLYKMRDDKGNLFSWFASNDILSDSIGEKVSVSAGIKRHAEYKGVFETQLTRVKIIDDIETAEMLKAAPIKVKYEIRLTDLTVNQNDVFYVNGTYYRIRVTKGTAYAVKFTENGWEYAPKAIHSLTVAMVVSAEDAARFGKEYKRCIYCGKALTDERSAKVGYGETCAHTHGLPWG